MKGYESHIFIHSDKMFFTGSMGVVSGSTWKEEVCIGVREWLIAQKKKKNTRNSFHNTKKQSQEERNSEGGNYFSVSSIASFDTYDM